MSPYICIKDVYRGNALVLKSPGVHIIDYIDGILTIYRNIGTEYIVKATIPNFSEKEFSDSFVSFPSNLYHLAKCIRGLQINNGKHLTFYKDEYYPYQILELDSFLVIGLDGPIILEKPVFEFLFEMDEEDTIP